MAIVLPSGYIGVSAWSALLLSGLGGGSALARLALGAWAGALAAGAVVIVRRAGMRADGAWILLSCAAAVVCIARPDGALAWHYLLANGAFVGVHAIWDVHDDTVSRVLRGSDASEFASHVLGDESRSRAVGLRWTAVYEFVPAAAALVAYLRLERAGGPVWVGTGTGAALWGPHLLLVLASAISVVALRPWRYPAATAGDAPAPSAPSAPPSPPPPPPPAPPAPPARRASRPRR